MQICKCIYARARIALTLTHLSHTDTPHLMPKLFASMLIHVWTVSIFFIFHFLIFMCFSFEREFDVCTFSFFFFFLLVGYGVSLCVWKPTESCWWPISENRVMNKIEFHFRFSWYFNVDRVTESLSRKPFGNKGSLPAFSKAFTCLLAWFDCYSCIRDLPCMKCQRNITSAIYLLLFFCYGDVNHTGISRVYSEKKELRNRLNVM